jgi:hypothetical protein
MLLSPRHDSPGHGIPCPHNNYARIILSTVEWQEPHTETTNTSRLLNYKSLKHTLVIPHRIHISLSTSCKAYYLRFTVNKHKTNPQLPTGCHQPLLHLGTVGNFRDERKETCYIMPPWWHSTLEQPSLRGGRGENGTQTRGNQPSEREHSVS